MKKDSIKERIVLFAGQKLVWAFIVIASLAVIGFHLYLSLKGNSFYRHMHWGTVLDYYQNGIDLLRPVIIGFNLNGAPTPQEIPIWQGLSAGMMSVLNGSKTGPILVSLTLFLTSLYPVYAISKRFLPSKCCQWILLAYLLQPLVFIYAGLGSPDGLSLYLQLWFVYFALRALDQPKVGRVLIAVLLGFFSATTKLPFFMLAGIFLALYLCFVEDGFRVEQWICLCAIGLVASIGFFIWSYWCSQQYALAEYPHFELRMSENPEAVSWYFGDWETRTDVRLYAKAIWRLGNGVFGSFALLALIPVFLLKRELAFAYLWLLAAIFTTMVFSSLVMRHSHYYLMVSFPVSVILGYAVYFVGREKSKEREFVITCIGFLFLAGATVQGCYTFIGTSNDRYLKGIHKEVSGVLSEGEKIAVVNNAWGDFFVVSGMRGVNASQYYKDADFLDRLEEEGYRHILFLSESPILAAKQRTHIGNSGRERVLYTEFLEAYPPDLPIAFSPNDDFALVKIEDLRNSQ